MKIQYENLVTSSFLLWFDHTLLKKGEAFTNFGSYLYPVEDLYQGYYTFSAPFKQFVTDSSIPGAQIPTGLYVDGSIVSTGVSPLVAINYDQGQGYFDADMSSSTISGDYSVKDFNVYLTSKAEQELLFETKISLRNSTAQVVTGLAPNINTYPAIFIKNNGGGNSPFAFGGQDRTEINLRALVLADSQFGLDAVCSIFKDEARNYIDILPEEKFPFNTLGNLKNSVYDYDNVIAGNQNNVFINSVDVSRYNVGYMEGLNNANPDIFRAMVDFELEALRFPRQE